MELPQVPPRQDAYCGWYGQSYSVVAVLLPALELLRVLVLELELQQVRVLVVEPPLAVAVVVD